MRCLSTKQPKVETQLIVGVCHTLGMQAAPQECWKPQQVLIQFLYPCMTAITAKWERAGLLERTSAAMGLLHKLVAQAIALATWQKTKE